MVGATPLTFPDAPYTEEYEKNPFLLALHAYSLLLFTPTGSAPTSSGLYARHSQDSDAYEDGTVPLNRLS